MATTTTARKTAAKKAAAPEAAAPETIEEAAAQIAEQAADSGLVTPTPVAPNYNYAKAFVHNGVQYTFRKVRGFESQDFLDSLLAAPTEDFARALAAASLEPLLGAEQTKAFREADPEFEDMLVAWNAIREHVLGNLEKVPTDDKSGVVAGN